MTTPPSSSSGWIWMKGIDEAINTTNVLPPVNKKDKRPIVEDLIEKHATKIKEVKDGLAADPLYDESKHDDLWIVRFLMSHKKPKNAIKAAKATLLFRNEHKLDETDIRYIPITSKDCPCEPAKRYLACCDPDFIQCTLPDPQLGVVVYILYKAMDQHKLIEEVPPEDWLPTLNYVSEWSFQWIDYVTRTTGRLTKYIRLVDTAGFKMAGFSMEVTTRDGKAFGALQDYYPQALQAILCCNPPSWAGAVWKVVRPLCPKRVTDKVDFMSPVTNEKEKKRLFGYISNDNLPTRYGGNHQSWPVEYTFPDATPTPNNKQ